jgi:hypothetical protein
MPRLGRFVVRLRSLRADFEKTTIAAWERGD